MKRNISELRHEASQLAPILNIGKNGITDPLIEELNAQLKRSRLVKVKILPAALNDTDRRSIADELSRRTGSQLVEVRGSNAVLYRGKNVYIGR